MHPITDAVLRYLYFVYKSDVSQYTHFNTVYMEIYEWIFQNHQYEVTQSDITSSLEYLEGIGYIQSDREAYRLTAYGENQLEYPPTNYEELNLSEAQRANQIATKALYIAALSLLVAIGSLMLSWYFLVSP